MKKHFEENKSNYLNNPESEKLPTFSCDSCCLTINQLISDRFDLSTDTLNFFITESRNELKSELQRLITKAKNSDRKMEIQISGSIGTGKTYGLAEFVVLERMLNLETKDKFIIYHNFNQMSNRECTLYIKEEIFCALYPFIKDELQKLLNQNLNNLSIKLQENSLLHLVLELINETLIDKQIFLIERIFKIIAETYPDSQILIILDQINEVEKGEDSFESKQLFKFLRKYNQKNISKIFCASNNNDFNRNNIIFSREMNM